MTHADPTMDLYHALKRADPAEWGRIIYGMPIFVEHDGYEVPGEGGPRLVVVPKGDEPPANGKKIYTVDKARLQATCDEINKNFDGSAKPIKLFIGHSNPKDKQENNPALAGFGRGAYMGTFGPRNIPAIKTDAFYKHGFEGAAAEYPERSPEFLPRTNAITGVALLKTDPRLPMGMVSYSEDREVIYYGVGFVSERFDYSDETAPGGSKFLHSEDSMSDKVDYADPAHKGKGPGGGQFTSSKSFLASKNAVVASKQSPHGEHHDLSEKAHAATVAAHSGTGTHRQALAAHMQAGLSHNAMAGKVTFENRGDMEHHHAARTHHLEAAQAHMDEDKVHYGEDDKPNDKPNETDETEGQKAPVQAGASPEPEDDDDQDDGKPAPLEPHEIKFADRMMAHLEQNHPAIKHLCGEHKKYLETQGAMAAPKANGDSPNGDDEKKPSEERIDMSDPTIAVLTAKIAAIEQENALLYAEKEIGKLASLGIKFKDIEAEKKKLVPMTPEQRKERLDEIRLNYAREERAPVSRGFLPIDAGHVEGATEKVKDEPESPDDVNEILDYAEENGVSFEQAQKKWAAEKKKQTA